MSEDQKHWLVRPRTIRNLWIGSGVVLAITVLLQLVIPIKGHFGIDSYFGFFAAFGFFSCVAMVIAAKFLGIFLKRPDDYYDN